MHMRQYQRGGQLTRSPSMARYQALVQTKEIVIQIYLQGMLENLILFQLRTWARVKEMTVTFVDTTWHKWDSCVGRLPAP